MASAPQVPAGLAGLPIVGERLADAWNHTMLAEGGIRAVLEPYAAALRQAFVGVAGALAESVLQIILSLGRLCKRYSHSSSMPMWTMAR